MVHKIMMQLIVEGILHLMIWYLHSPYPLSLELPSKSSKSLIIQQHDSHELEN